MSIVTLDEARRTLQIDDDDDSVNDELQTYVDAITTIVGRHVGEVIERRTITERIRLRRGAVQFALRYVPVVSLTSLTSLLGHAWDVSGMDVDASGTVEVFRGVQPYGTALAVYEAGYATVPENYKRGALIILQHIWESQRGAGVVLGGVVGEEERLNRVWMYDIPRKALEWLGEPAPGVG
jgi:hypothetical protein